MSGKVVSINLLLSTASLHPLPYLSLLIIAVHDPNPSLVYLRLVPKYVALLEHGVHEGCLTVVDVGDHGNVTDVSGTCHHRGIGLEGERREERPNQSKGVEL